MFWNFINFSTRYKYKYKDKYPNKAANRKSLYEYKIQNCLYQTFSFTISMTTWCIKTDENRKTWNRCTFMTCHLSNLKDPLLPQSCFLKKQKTSFEKVHFSVKVQKNTYHCVEYTEIWTQSLILHQMLTFQKTMKINFS